MRIVGRKNSDSISVGNRSVAIALGGLIFLGCAGLVLYQWSNRSAQSLSSELSENVEAHQAFKDDIYQMRVKAANDLAETLREIENDRFKYAKSQTGYVATREEQMFHDYQMDRIEAQRRQSIADAEKMRE